MENVFTCVAYKSAVDVSKLAFNDFLSIYGPVLRAAYGNDQSKLKEMIQQAKEVYSLFNIKAEGTALFAGDKMIDISGRNDIVPFLISTSPASKGDF